ncbi:CD63 antigen isoform X1 [Amyelois transitella]|uniref:CD63 antigen isoform X1 n=1 Tax=Amyelois transitella TaxID=680683 RepID=UPI00067A7EA4|nr:CD63 antigen isoform X1 [Amyelois transitella]
MGCGTSFVKYVLFFFNLVVALFGLAIVGIGVAFLLKWNTVTDLLHGMNVGPWLFIIIGAIMFFIAFFGCCGAIRESHCMVVTYAIFLLVIIILQVVLAVLLFVYGGSIKNEMEHTIDTMFKNRGENEASVKVFESIEKQFQCCGARGKSDYGVLSTPKSCCNENESMLNTDYLCTSYNHEGCANKLGALYEKWNKPIAAIAIGVACVEVIGALFALCLANSIRNMDRRSRY